MQFSSELIVNCSSIITWVLAALLTCSTCLSAQAAEYCLRPDKRDGTQADNVVCCSTPNGWVGWKDDLEQLARTKKLFNDPPTRVLFQRSVWFFPSNCVADDKFRKKRPECPSLTLEARTRNSRGRSDVARELRRFLRELRDHPPDVYNDCDPVVSRFASFDVGNSRDLTIWQIHCRKRRESRSGSSSNDYLLTMIGQRDVIATIYLEALDIKDIIPKLDSLKQLARSVRITDASLVIPDIVDIDADRLSDEPIRQQLLQLTPRGTPVEKVYDLLQLRLKESPGLAWLGRDCIGLTTIAPTPNLIREHIITNIINQSYER